MFTTIGNRNDHERRHIKDKPYICNFTDHCRAKYYRKYQLVKHILSKHKSFKLNKNDMDKIKPSNYLNNDIDEDILPKNSKDYIYIQ